ncbi:formate dehydrogenase, nitrate-inducible, major subunit [Escherichia coli]|uniref:Formate dehydrogenase, nitrate-inducible, major subunit n=1 Tax=Escherichia coli TaxID=562 RepID=A0A377D5P3_ECOLX|nr:formate dehydrogenase, nitrate-inducible, major subunit [Escherichia coli]
MVSCLSKLKYMVVIDPLVTETSTFWQNHGESNDVDPASIQTEVFRLPSTCFAEEDGSIANSGRWLQWHWKGQDARAKRVTTAKFWRVSTIICASCTRPKVVKA